jgi:hypothetical protein
MNAQTEMRVDVVAVLVESADWLYRSSEGKEDDRRAEQVRQAGAAVAELIEKADNAEKAIRSLVINNLIEAQALTYANDLRAALARVGGAA